MPYHLRRSEKSIDDLETRLEILTTQCIMTLALCKDNEPYLVTVDYAFDPATETFFFHSARTGKKIDYLQANPLVWGQVLEDRGYLPGKCDHAYRTIQFRGHAAPVTDPAQKLYALGLLIDQIDPDSKTVRQQQLSNLAALDTVEIIAIQVESWSGKQGPKKKD